MNAIVWADVEKLRGRGSTGALPPLFRGLGEKERRALVPDLKAAFAALDRIDWRERNPHLRFLKVCGAACLGGPAAIAQWLGHRELVTWSDDGKLTRDIVAVLVDRDPDKVGDIAERLAARTRVEGARSTWELVDALARQAGAPPDSEAYVPYWLEQVMAGLRTTAEEMQPLADGLAADPFTPVMLGRFFETERVGREVRKVAGVLPDRTWGTALGTLAERGVVDRADVLDRALGRFLRGVREAADLRGFLDVYEDLAVTDEEARARVAVYLRLLPDTPSLVAALAQDVLRRLDAAGMLTADQVEEASRAVLFRAEKTLIRTQLTWLGQAVKRHPEHSALLVAAAATVFAHPDSGIHERALTFLGKHMPKLADAGVVREELRTAAELLEGPLRDAVFALLGEEAPAEESGTGDAGPHYAAAELPADIASLDDLVDELVVYVAAVKRGLWAGVRGTQAEEPWHAERLIGSMIREHARDRTALAEAIRPVLERVRDADMLYLGADSIPDVHCGIAAIVSAAAGHGIPVRDWAEKLFGDRTPRDGRSHVAAHLPGPHRVLAGRLFETAERLRTPHADPYLARPVDPRGYVDPAALVDGLEAYEAAGRAPWPLDLEQALLRLPAAVPADVRARAAGLTGQAGRHAARVLAEGGLPDVAVTGVETVRYLNQWAQSPGTPQYFRMATTGPVPDLYAGGVLVGALCGLDDPLAAHESQDDYFFSDMPAWPLVAPRHRDLVAAHAVPTLVYTTERPRAGADILPWLAASDGVAGDGMAAAFAYALGAQDADERAYAVDGLVTLAARGDQPWAADVLGSTLAALIGSGSVKTTRIAESLRLAATAGASKAVWAVTSALLPGLKGERPAGLGDLLAVAADTASRSGARGVLIGLDAYVGKGSSRIAVEARRLTGILAADGPTR